ncbi:helix-turn-helix transcriptional regulator [Erwinia psidii]|uniref:LuxR family transcriptional regulator n=1 Tax=Erwinia psidii TaxID=69224 RepID=A0A3N6TUJ1_9GAMM|nr:LuxR family transcriptional regulator [Erwinia psidii]MCX8958736.1 LuxR family transcriptional regulator [Erwinia psidii]MCX8961136.1 LuxR family transcriptional regulator [Erwinia psidii]MCX8966693.1 LuxR family transcriptional regulator [Erwinia psidii]RQM38932.1 LuxR family transcriptional regulator [Erwinia psidii]
MFSLFRENRTLKDTLRAYIDRKLSPFGELEYAYTVVGKKNPSDVLIISSYPDEWIRLYQTGQFQLTDPVILTAFRRTSPFAWDENITLMSELRFTRIFSLSRQYNIVNGYTFVLHDHMNNLALLSFIIKCNDQGGLEQQQRLSSEQAVLQMLLIDFNEQMYRLAGPDIAGAMKTATAEEKAIFSPRENEVLYWVSMGKTYAEIAVIAGISLSTVKFHMKNVLLKLGVSNTPQAVRLGIELDLIRPAASVAR